MGHGTHQPEAMHLRSKTPPKHAPWAIRIQKLLECKSRSGFPNQRLFNIFQPVHLDPFTAFERNTMLRCHFGSLKIMVHPLHLIRIETICVKYRWCRILQSPICLQYLKFSWYVLMKHVSAGLRVLSLGNQGTFCKPCIASSRCPTSSP